MPRIRTIKPTFWGSRPVAKLSRDARLLAIGLISFADDDGRFLASTATINGFVFPNDELAPAKVRKWLDECVGSGLVHEYERDGIRYGCFPTWHEHQVINRHTPSTLPEPDVRCVPRSTKQKGSDSRSDSVSDSRSPHGPTHDRKGREGKGSNYLPLVTTEQAPATADSTPSELAW